MNIQFANNLLALIAMALLGGEDDRTQARQDHQYVVELAQQEPLSIDFSDPRQYRFVVDRLKQVGKTATQSPNLFQTITAQAVDSDGNAEQPGQSERFPGDPNFSFSDHFPLNLVSGDGLNFEATALTTVYGGTDYTFIDVSTWDENWNQVGKLGWNEVYAAGTEVIARCKGKLPHGPENLLYTDSLQMYQISDGNGKPGAVKATYVFQLGSALPAIHLEEPRRITTNVAPKIDVCLNRSNSDCDYISMGDTVMRLPFRGSYRIQIGHQVVGFEPGSSLKLIGLEGPVNGGTAEFVSNLTGYPIEAFFSHRQAGGYDYIDWDFSTTDGHFGNVIFDAHAVVNWFLKIHLRIVSIYRPYPIIMVADINSHLLTNPVEITGYPILPINFIYSCQAPSKAPLLSRLPSAWHKDYHHSQQLSNAEFKNGRSN